MIGSKLVTFRNNISVPSSRFMLDCLTLEDGTDGYPETPVTTNVRWVTSQKSDDLISHHLCSRQPG